MSEFIKLFEAGRIGRLEVKNRIIFPPICTHWATKEEGVSDQQIVYYAERAKGGAGLIVIEPAYPRSGGYPGRIHLDDDRFIPGLRRLVEAIHKGGAKAVIQLATHRGIVDERDLAAPSHILHSLTKAKPRQISVTDITKIKDEFGEGVRRAKEASFDGVMIHGAGGYLVAEFLSPLTNKRTDEYGGDPKRRAKFALELVEVTRKKVGSDYPVIFRFSGDERIEGGFRVKDAIAFCHMLEEAGVDGVSITSGTQITHEWGIPPAYLPAGCNVDISEAIRKEIKIPVSIAGKINNPYLAEEILREGKADFVDIGRSLVADPWFPKKAMEGRLEDIRKCIACCKCWELVINHIPMSCSVNPTVGREKEFELGLKPVEKKKRVLVVGGGPAGMEAAIIATQKGHRVTLWEASDRLGGQLNLAHVSSGKSDIRSFLEYLKAQLGKSEVIVELGKKATVATVVEFAPDAVIVATGSTPFIVDVPGIKGENVIGNREVLSGERQTGDKVVVWGSGLVGCETAYFLAEKGKNVTQVFRGLEPAPDVTHPDNKKLLIKKLKESKVKIEVGAKQFKEITPEGIKLIDKEGQEVFLEADNIVLATGARPDKTLAQLLKGKVRELYEVGDCVEARRILEAIHEGAGAALEI